MPPTSIRMAIAACLQNLSKEDLEKFCHALIHRGGDPRVRRNKVEEKTLLQITDTLVNTFTEPGALKVTLELLRNVDCSDDADELVKDTKSLTISTPTSSSAAEASGGAANLPALPTKKHFIDKHRLTLISRVTNLDPILDELLEQVIDDGVYNKIKAEQTTQKMMRAIMDGPMKGGTKCKDILYEILERHERYLLEELNSA